MLQTVPKADDADQILDTAEQLLMSNGFGSLNMAEIAHALALSEASLLCHFESKNELGHTLVERYRTGFFAALDEIDRKNKDARGKLRQYIQIYADVLHRNRTCLCIMLASEFTNLPRPMRDGVRKLFEGNEVWLARVLEEGRRKQELVFQGEPKIAANVLTSALEGALLLARMCNDATRFEATAGLLLKDFGAAEIAS